MNNTYGEHVISLLNHKINNVKTRENKNKQIITAFEEHMSYFFEQLDVFILKTVPKCLDHIDYVVCNGKLYLKSEKLPYIQPKNGVYDLGMDVFIYKVGDMIRKDPRFLAKREQLINETGLVLEFDDMQYGVDDIRFCAEYSSTGSFCFYITLIID
jgi:hypothetical protein